MTLEFNRLRRTYNNVFSNLLYDCTSLRMEIWSPMYHLSAISHVAISSVQGLLTPPIPPTLRADELQFVELDPVPVTTPESPFSYH
jgi:hypothetical protein